MGIYSPHIIAKAKEWGVSPLQCYQREKQLEELRNKYFPHNPKLLTIGTAKG